MINRLPQLIQDSLKQINQDEVYHPEGSVYNHIVQVHKNVMDFQDGDIDIQVAAIFHDLGKLKKTQHKRLYNSDGQYVRTKVSHIGHEYASLSFIEPLKQYFDDLDVNWDKVYSVVENHMKAYMYLNGSLKKAHKRIKFESLEYFYDIVRFAMCDEFNPLKSTEMESFNFQLQDGRNMYIDIHNIILS